MNTRPFTDRVNELFSKANLTVHGKFQETKLDWDYSPKYLQEILHGWVPASNKPIY